MKPDCWVCNYCDAHHKASKMNQPCGILDTINGEIVSCSGIVTAMYSQESLRKELEARMGRYHFIINNVGERDPYEFQMRIKELEYLKAELTAGEEKE